MTSTDILYHSEFDPFYMRSRIWLGASLVFLCFIGCAMIFHLHIRKEMDDKYYTELNKKYDDINSKIESMKKRYYHPL